MYGDEVQFNGSNEGGNAAECVWMVAGVVGYKLCDRQFDCEHCPFDLAIRDGGHSFSGRKAEPSLTDLGTGGPLSSNRGERADLGHVGDCSIVQSVFYHPGHVWARIEDGGSVRVGLDDFGQRIVGRVYSVALPVPGAEAQEGSSCWGISHQAGETDLLTPVPGIIRQINPRLVQQPSLINRNPYGEGWAFIIQPANLEYSLKQLYYGDRAARWLANSLDHLRLETERLVASSSPDLGMTLPDGGVAVKDLRLLLESDLLQKLIDSFLSHPANCQLVRDAGKGR